MALNFYRLIYITLLEMFYHCTGYIFHQKMISLDIILMRFFGAEYVAIRYEDLVDTTTYSHSLVRDVFLF